MAVVTDFWAMAGRLAGDGQALFGAVSAGRGERALSAVWQPVKTGCEKAEKL